jgi:hypothetical protein
MRVIPLLTLFVIVGCGGETTEPPKETPPVGENPTAPPPTAPPTLGAAELAAQAENTALVPSPAEMQKALDKAGIAGGLSTMVADRDFKMDGDNKDVVAVRTGVVLADALLTVKDAPKDKLLARLDKIKAGLAALNAGADLAATIDELSNNVKNDVTSRDDLLKELDELHGAVIPEIKFEAGDRIVPLLQAGSWLEGSNLVASAIVTANKADAGTALLRQPQVVSYFQKYVQVEGPDKAPVEVLKQLEATLTKLGEIAAKPTLTIEDVTEVKTQTSSVLALL